jgi:hypothetical protein
MRRLSGGTDKVGDDSTRLSISIVPALGEMKPAIMRRVVVLPQPDGPSSDTNSPVSSASEKSSTAVNGPNVLETLRSTSLAISYRPAP